MKRNKSDESSATHWQFVADVSRTVDTWPAWKKRGFEENRDAASNSGQTAVSCTTDTLESRDNHK